MRDPGLGGRGAALAVPRHALVHQRVHALVDGGDVEAVADRLGMAEQPDEGLGEPRGGAPRPAAVAPTSARG
jgi:hypothetical protein